MNYRLSDIERTLLSAYLDGELSGRELADAEGLLAASGEARRYLDELRLVDSLSSNRTGNATTAGGISGGGATTKLSGGAIEAAAERAVYAKAMTAGAWGVGGIVSAAAAVVVGIALAVQSPKEPVEVAARPQKQERIAQSTPATQPMVDLDTNDLMIPPMTTSDLLAFAVHGTLPIDSERNRFITLAPKGENALVVQVHDRAPEDMSDELDEWNVAETRALDSIQRVIRTSLFRLSKEGIALREDIPSLRLGVIRSLERAAPRMPSQVRVQLNRTCNELNAQNQTRYTTSGTGVQIGGSNVHYRVLSIDDAVNSVTEPFTSAEGGFIFNIEDEPAILIDQSSLSSLQSHMRIPVPPMMPPPQSMMTLAPRPVVVNNPAGEKVVRKRAQKSQGFAPPDDPFEHSIQQQMVIIDSANSDALFPAFDVLIHTNDSLVFRAHKSLRKSEEALRRADSILRSVEFQRKQRLRSREWEKMYKDLEKAQEKWEEMQQEIQEKLRKQKDKWKEFNWQLGGSGNIWTDQDPENDSDSTNDD